MEVFVCVGSDCRKAGSAHAALRSALDEVGDVRVVRCQKICSGPVAGLDVNGRLEWFEKVGGPKSRRALARFVGAGGPLPKRLRKRRVRKRAGHLRGRSSRPTG